MERRTRILPTRACSRRQFEKRMTSTRWLSSRTCEQMRTRRHGKKESLVQGVRSFCNDSGFIGVKRLWPIHHPIRTPPFCVYLRTYTLLIHPIDHLDGRALFAETQIPKIRVIGQSTIINWQHGQDWWSWMTDPLDYRSATLRLAFWVC